MKHGMIDSIKPEDKNMREVGEGSGGHCTHCTLEFSRDLTNNSSSHLQ